MTAPAVPPSDTPPDRLAAARTDDLRELLGHLTTSWDDDRRLLARKLHDTIGSSMTALTMHLHLLNAQLPKEQALLDRTAQMKQLLQTLITTNREMQVALWNDKLEFLGLRAAISEAVDQFREQHGLVTRVSLPEHDTSYPRLQGVALLRCLEEGLRNIAAHAHATEVDVILDDDGDQVTLTVRDNGVGIDASVLAAADRHGLRALRERAAYLGGRLTAAPAPHGTVLTLTLPRDDAAGGALSAA
ncbi:histidine kinase [Massilia sp. R2A-15]|uniref:sensor histidine kinase n=1 Tax=Massilia sp. R2A-15 TaxID=3064278 RepID=UPI0027367B4F|nr:ATP-binding protein [Massilia sp. R2A-15]WLI90878.1 histidine kinase [Massilia sp. R2A-15]